MGAPVVATQTPEMGMETLGIDLDAVNRRLDEAGAPTVQQMRAESNVVSYSNFGEDIDENGPIAHRDDNVGNGLTAEAENSERSRRPMGRVLATAGTIAGLAFMGALAQREVSQSDSGTAYAAEVSKKTKMTPVKIQKMIIRASSGAVNLGYDDFVAKRNFLNPDKINLEGSCGKGTDKTYIKSYTDSGKLAVLKYCGGYVNNIKHDGYPDGYFQGRLTRITNKVANSVGVSTNEHGSAKKAYAIKSKAVINFARPSDTNSVARPVKVIVFEGKRVRIVRYSPTT